MILLCMVRGNKRKIMAEMDIVDRLRDEGGFAFKGMPSLRQEAASEIEKLRNHNAMYKSAAKKTEQLKIYAVADERHRCMRIAKSVIDPEADKSWNMAARLILETISGDCT